MLIKFKTLLTQFCRIFTWQRFANVLAVLIVFYLLVAYFAVNPIAKKIIPRIADKSLNSVASINRVEFDPYRLKITVNDFKLAKKESGEKLLGFKKLIVDFELSGIFDLAWKFKQIAIAEPRIDLAMDSNGQFNWDALIAKLNEGPEKAPSDTIPSVIIEQFFVSNGTLHYSDATSVEPIDMTLEPLSFQLKGFSTVPRDRGEYYISAAFSDDGGVLKWKGDMGVNPLASTGLIAIEGVKVAETLQLVRGLSLPISIQNGEAYTSFNYDFSMPKRVPTVNLTDIKLGLTDLSGELLNGGHVDLKHAGLVVNNATFVKDKQPEMRLKQLALQSSDLKVSQGDGAEAMLKDLNLSLNQIDFQMQGDVPQLIFNDLKMALLDLNLHQDNGAELMLRESNVSLPELDFHRQDDMPQLLFNDLNIALLDINLHQGDALNVYIPSSKINTLNVDLLKSTIAFNDIVLSDIRLGKQLNQAAIKDERSDESLAKLSSLIVDDGEIVLSDKTISIQSIMLDGFTTSVVRNADGTINWIALLNAQEAASTSESAEQSTKQIAVNTVNAGQADDSEDTAIESSEDQNAAATWTITLPKLALNNANIHIQDNGAPLPVVLDVEEATVALENISLDMTKPLPIKAAFKVKQGGQFSTKGQLWPSPLKADLVLRLSKLSLKPFAPYINQFALLKLNGGNASVSGKLNVTQKQALALAFNGGFNVAQLAVVEEVDDKPFLSWNRLGSDQLKLTLAPNDLKVGTLKIDQPSAKFIINEDKTTNLSRVLRSNDVTKPSIAEKNQTIDQSSKALTNTLANDNSLIKGNVSSPTDNEKAKESQIKAESGAVSTAEVSFPISIDTVRLNDAQLEFADLSLKRQFRTDIHSLNGVINGLSTKANKIAQLEMEGKVDEYGSAKISGSLQPFNVTEFTDIRLAFANLDMTKLTPYSGKFSGRYIDSGKLSVDLGYKIKQQQLIGENKFIINKLKLGEKVESDDAADLPLDLAIAILEDNDGVINLDLPISGSLDNPEFSFASIAWKAFRNVLTKIVTAPFRVLGKLLGGNGEDFDGIAFDAGNSQISPPELEKLAKVSVALEKRQGLLLGIVPSYSADVDTQAIKEERYRKQVIEEMGVDLEEGQKPGPIDLGNEDVQDAIDTLYNDLTNKGLLNRLASKFEEPEEGHYEKAQLKLIESIEVTEAELKALAEARSKVIEATLISNGVSQDRLSVVGITDVKAHEKMVKIELKLDAKVSAKAMNQDDELKERQPMGEQ